MTTRKIVSDEVDYIFTPSVRKNINNALVLTGGGTLQTFFSMGAVGCLIDNGLFDFELISSVSGGALLLTIIDLCYNPEYNYFKQKNWYNRYVRKSIYNAAGSKLVPYVFKTGIDLKATEEYIFSVLPDFNKDLNKENDNIICEYNFIDANLARITCDHSDIIDIKNGIKKPYWYIVRPLRCGLPFCNFYNRPTYDAGNIGNIPVESILTRYNPKRLIIIKVYSKLTYDYYPDSSYYDLAKKWLINNVAASEASIDNLLDLPIQENDKNIICSISNGLNKSKDNFHRNLFDDIANDYDVFARLYNGVLYYNEDVAKIIENEGYIQMYHQLKRTKEAIVFKIPNPDVYNKNAKKILRDWKNQNIFSEFAKDFIRTQI
jgi:hypothetical protein